MENFHICKHQILQRTNVLGIDQKITKPFIKDVFKWLENSGPEWTVKRLKSIKNDFILLHAQSATIQTPWIRVNPQRTKFLGILGLIQELSYTNHKNFNRVLNLLNVYTSIVSSNLLSSQKEKFLSAVNDSGVPVPPEFHQLISSTFNTLPTITSQEKISGPLVLSGYRKPSHMKRAMEEVRLSFRVPEFQHLWFDAGFTRICFPALNSVLNFRGLERNPFPEIGKIGITQEPGLKARFYAAPHIWVQHVLTPMGTQMYDYIKNHAPWDCTFDQDKAIPDIQSTLKQGDEVFCYDLSSATDRFPLELQITMMNSLFSNKEWHDHIRLFQYFCTLPFSFEGEPIIWKRGQPLGMFPSFAMFTLTHGILLYALNGNKWNNDFFVLGDDVIILNKNLSLAYESALKDLDVPYSPDKTISSKNFGEFTGRIVLPDKVFPILKWKTLKPDNYLDTVKNWGIASLTLLPKKVRPYVKVIASLPEPWGVGYNPEGVSLEERFSRVGDLLDQETNIGYLASYRDLVYEYYKYSNIKYTKTDLSKNLSLADTADQAYQTVLRKYIPVLEDHFMVSGRNLMDVQPELSLKLDTYPKTRRPGATLNVISQGLLGKLMKMLSDKFSD